MTTIAYDGKTVAVDSRRTRGSVIITDKAEKFKISGSDVFILAGATDEINFFVRNFQPNKECDMNGCDASGVLISDGHVYAVGVHEGRLFSCVSTGDAFCDGSGGSFAISSIDHGKTAEQAVKYAITRDIYSGGHVHVFCAKTGKKLK